MRIKEFYKEKCAVCGEDANYMCKDNVCGVLSCGIPLCGRRKCVQTHLKEWHNDKQFYICIKDFCIEEANEDGGIIDGSYVNIDKDSLWTVDNTRNLCGGDIRLLRVDCVNNYEWLEISSHTFLQCFQPTK